MPIDIDQNGARMVLTTVALVACSAADLIAVVINMVIRILVRGVPIVIHSLALVGTHICRVTAHDRTVTSGIVVDIGEAERVSDLVREQLGLRVGAMSTIGGEFVHGNYAAGDFTRISIFVNV